MEEFNLPTETIDLPSKGLLYPEESELSKGKIEMKYMTAREEDILTNQNYIKNGTVIDKLLQSMIVSNIVYDDLLIADKDAIMIASRILGYGEQYTFTYVGEENTIDLTELKDKEFDESLFTPFSNQFNFELPHSKVNITFKLLTHGDDKKITRELEGLKKIKGRDIPEMSTRLKHIITSVNGNSDPKSIREFVDKYLLAKDARALREHIVKISPGIDLKVSLTTISGDVEEDVTLPIGVNFFWPESDL
jgi:hypothetical protein